MSSCSRQAAPSRWSRCSSGSIGVVRRVDVTTYSFNTHAAARRRNRPHRDNSSPARASRRSNRCRSGSSSCLTACPKMKQAVQWHKYRSQDAGLIWLRGLIREVA